MFNVKTREGLKEVKPGDHWMDIASGISGHFAVEYWINPDMGGFAEPWDTGLGRYATAKEAYEEAKIWAAQQEQLLTHHPELE